MSFFLEINPKNLDKHANTNKKFRFFEKLLYLPNIIKNILSHPLNKDQKLKSLLRFFLFQFELRLFNKKKKFKWIDSTYLEVSLGDSSLVSNYYLGLYEFESMAFILHSLKKEYLFVDVGANLGSHSILASSVVGSETIAFEPNEDAVKKIFKQLEINDIESKVKVKKLGIGDKVDNLYFTNNRDALNRVAIPNKDKSFIKTEISTLDLEINTTKKIIMKIDVEGFEMNVLKGANELLKSDKLLAIVVEINGFNRNYGFNEKDIHNLILSYDFIQYYYNPFTREIKKELTSDIYSDKDDFIYIKKYDEIANNCKNSKKRVLHLNKNLLI